MLKETRDTYNKEISFALNFRFKTKFWNEKKLKNLE